jgi:hypothetical protein
MFPAASLVAEAAHIIADAEPDRENHWKPAEDPERDRHHLCCRFTRLIVAAW